MALAVAVPQPALAQTNGAGVKYAILEISSSQAHGPNDQVYIYGIGNAGDVVGSGNIGSVAMGIDWLNGHIVQYLGGLIQGHEGVPYAANSIDTIAGFSTSDQGFFNEATVWLDGQTIGLGSLGGQGSQAFAVNDLNHVTGWADLSGDVTTDAFLWHDGIMDDLGTLTQGLSSFGNGINNLDQVAGFSAIDIGVARAVLWDHGSIINLGTLPGGDAGSRAYAINDLAQVVGWSFDANLRTLAFIWQNGQMQSIHDFSLGTFSEAFAINNHSQVVGNISGDGVFNYDCFIWDPINGMHNIEEYLPPDSGWDLTYARGINDYGQIAGYGTRHGQQVGYMVTPVNSTLHMDDPNPGRAGRNNTFTIHNADPGKTIYFMYGRKGGGYLIPGCNSQTGAVLQMDDPTVIGTATADANGDASITAFVPNAARNAGDILLQAVEQPHCKISQLVVTRFQ